METVTTAILDKFPMLRQYKIWVVLSVAIFGYVGGLGFTTNVSSKGVDARSHLFIEYSTHSNILQ